MWRGHGAVIVTVTLGLFFRPNFFKFFLLLPLLVYYKNKKGPLLIFYT